MLMSSCAKSDPTTEIIELTNTTCEKLEKANNITDIQQISKDYSEQIIRIKKENPDYKPTDKEKEEIQTAVVNLSKLAAQKSADFLN